MFRFLSPLLFLIASSMIADDLSVFEASDYGATPNDGKDDTSALQALLTAAAKHHDSVVNLQKGVYEIRQSGRRSIGFAQENFALILEAADGLIINGNGAEILFVGKKREDYATILTIRDCRGVTVRDLTLDWKHLPYLQGYVAKVNDDSVEIELSDGFTLSSKSLYERLEHYDPITKLVEGYALIPRTHNPEKSRGRMLTPLGDNRVRVETLSSENSYLQKMREGMYCVITLRVYASNGFTLFRSKEITLDSVNIYAAAGMGVRGFLSENISIRKLNLSRRPDTNRCLSTTADATHFVDCGGSISLLDSRISGQGDDGINVHGTYLFPMEVIDDKVVRLKVPFPGAFPQVGDRMEISAPSGLIVSEGDVATIKKADQGIIVSFSESLPESMGPLHSFGNMRWLPTLEIRECRFDGNRGRGALIQTRDVVVKENRFEDISGPAIVAYRQLLQVHRESFNPMRVSIENNQIVRSPRLNNVSSIAVYANALSEEISKTGVEVRSPAGTIRDIKIVNNHIAEVENMGIYVTSTSDVTISGNTLEACSTNPRPVEWNHCAQFVIAVHDCSNVTVDNNAYRYESGEKTGKLLVEDKTTHGHRVIESNRGFKVFEVSKPLKGLPKD